MVSSTPRPHFTPGKDPAPILQEAGWAPGPVWKGGKSRPHSDSIPDRPARSHSLYRLNYQAHHTHTHTHTHTHMCVCVCFKYKGDGSNSPVATVCSNAALQVPIHKKDFPSTKPPNFTFKLRALALSGKSKPRSP